MFRSDVHINSRQSSVLGIFELKIDNPSSKDLTGTANTSAEQKETKLDAAFHAISNGFIREFAAENVKCLDTSRSPTTQSSASPHARGRFGQRRLHS